MEASQKRFRKRDAILRCLRQTDTHPSADWVYAQLKPQIPDLSIGTVYRNLALFKQQGLATSVATVNGVERFDGNTEPHVHFICTGCDAVIDLHSVPLPGNPTPDGCRIDGCQLSYTGLCQNCNK